MTSLGADTANMKLLAIVVLAVASFGALLIMTSPRCTGQSTGPTIGGVIKIAGC